MVEDIAAQVGTTIMLAAGMSDFYHHQKRWPNDYAELTQFLQARPERDQFGMLTNLSNVTFTWVTNGQLKVDAMFSYFATNQNTRISITNSALSFTLGPAPATERDLLK